MSARIMRIAAAEDGRPRGVVLGIATLLALLSASCCVLPIGLAIVGLGGAWLAVLGPFVAYRGSHGTTRARLSTPSRRRASSGGAARWQRPSGRFAPSTTVWPGWRTRRPM